MKRLLAGILLLTSLAAAAGGALNPMPGWMNPGGSGSGALQPPNAYPDTASVGDSAKMIWQIESGTIKSMTFAQLLALVSVGGLPDYLKPSDWSSATAYSQNEVVLYSNYLCVSSVAGSGTNTNHTPTVPGSNAYWGCYSSIGTLVTHIFNNMVSP